MAPKQFPAFSGSSQTVSELGVSQTVAEFLQAAPRPFLNFLGRVQESGEVKHRACSVPPSVNIGLAIWGPQTASKLFRQIWPDPVEN